MVLLAQLLAVELASVSSSNVLKDVSVVDEEHCGPVSDAEKKVK